MLWFEEDFHHNPKLHFEVSLNKKNNNIKKNYFSPRLKYTTLVRTYVRKPDQGKQAPFKGVCVSVCVCMCVYLYVRLCV